MPDQAPSRIEVDGDVVKDTYTTVVFNEEIAPDPFNLDAFLAIDRSQQFETTLEKRPLEAHVTEHLAKRRRTSLLLAEDWDDMFPNSSNEHCTQNLETELFIEIYSNELYTGSFTEEDFTPFGYSGGNP
jgi:hypothetical protein